MGKNLPERERESAGAKRDVELLREASKESLEIVRSASTALITFWGSISRTSRDSKRIRESSLG